MSVDIPEKGCVEFAGDLEWTMEALMNLIKNCMEHSSAGGTVHCDYAWNPLYVEITVRDEGEGFCPEDLPHLFERFYRGRRAAGTGSESVCPWPDPFLNCRTAMLRPGIFRKAEPVLK